jgi:hypothetical protein
VAATLPVAPSNPLHPKKTDYKRVALIAGALALVYLYLRSRSGSAAGTTAVLPVQTAVDPAVSGATNDLLGQLSSQMASQNNALGAILGGTQTTGGSTATTAPGAEPQVGALVGSGYLPTFDGSGQGAVEATPQGNYQYVGSPAQVAAFGGYKNLFFQPLPGDFTPWNPSSAPGTPMFAQVPFGSAPQQAAQTAVVAAAAGH